jgi:hypothetical protein
MKYAYQMLLASLFVVNAQIAVADSTVCKVKEEEGILPKLIVWDSSAATA